MAVKKLICLKCKYEWHPKDPNKKPGCCPRCKSYYYDQPNKREQKAQGK